MELQAQLVQQDIGLVEAVEVAGIQNQEDLEVLVVELLEATHWVVLDVMQQ
tara:strand:- start:169 stop:321 length:153 start_codon:yes stop_codon:yes gene_type:complete